MPRWILTNDQGFEANANEAMDTLEQVSQEAGQPMKLWKLHSEASVAVEVTITTEDD